MINDEIKHKIFLYIGNLISALGLMVMCIFMFENLFLNVAIGVSLCGIGHFTSAKTVTAIILKAMRDKGKSTEKR